MKPLLILGPRGQKVLWGGLKSVCLFPPSEVTLIIRNRRRCILVCMEFKVCPTPLCRHLSSFTSLEMGQRQACWVFFYETAMKMCTFNQDIFKILSVAQIFTIWDHIKLIVIMLKKENAALCVVCPVSSYPTWSLCNIDCSRQPRKVHFFNGV